MKGEFRMRMKIRVGRLKASILYHTCAIQFWYGLHKAGILSVDRVFKPITSHLLCVLRALAELVQIGECEPTEDLMNGLSEFDQFLKSEY